MFVSNKFLVKILIKKIRIKIKIVEYWLIMLLSFSSVVITDLLKTILTTFHNFTQFYNHRNLTCMFFNTHKFENYFGL